MKRVVFLFSLLFCFSAIAWGQPRPADKTVPATTRSAYPVRYEGGMFSGSKEKGDLKFDDANQRVVFHRKTDGKEMFHIPYDALLIIYPDSKDSTPQSGKVLSKVPLPGAGLFDLMSKSTKYANLTYDDPDVDVKGTASFRFEGKEQLLEFIHNLGSRAKLTQRGDAYYRPKKAVF